MKTIIREISYIGLWCCACCVCHLYDVWRWQNHPRIYHYSTKIWGTTYQDFWATNPIEYHYAVSNSTQLDTLWGSYSFNMPGEKTRLVQWVIMR